MAFLDKNDQTSLKLYKICSALCPLIVGPRHILLRTNFKEVQSLLFPSPGTFSDLIASHFLFYFVSHFLLCLFSCVYFVLLVSHGPRLSLAACSSPGISTWLVTPVFKACVRLSLCQSCLHSSVDITVLFWSLAIRNHKNLNST